MIVQFADLARVALDKSLEVREEAGIPFGVPLNVYDLCESLDPKVRVRFADYSMEGCYCRSARPLIEVSSLRPIGRRAFNTAHELGHHALGHAGMRLDEHLEDANPDAHSDPEEYAANAFAGFLLMPKIGVRRAFTARGWTIDDPRPEQVFTVACHFGVGYPTIGDFLAYQYVTDVNYSTVTDFSEMSFVVPGPGSIDGIRKCFADTGGLSNAEVIRFMADRQEIEFERLGLEFSDLWGRRLQLIDCQNLFCEVDKYARVRHPNIVGVSGRTRIKQKFRPLAEPIHYWYPPKWNIKTEANRPRPATVQDAPFTSSRASEVPMDFRSYQERAKNTDRNPATDQNGMMIPLLGLAGDATSLSIRGLDFRGTQCDVRHRPRRCQLHCPRPLPRDPAPAQT